MLISVSGSSVKEIKERKRQHALLEKNGAYIEQIMRFLPKALGGEIELVSLDAAKDGLRIEEIRIRSDRRVYLTVGGRGVKKNLLLSSALCADEVAEVLNRMCDGSLYAYGESIVKGYITICKGVRVGVCGHARSEHGRILGVYDISALNIRLPCERMVPAQAILQKIREALRRGEGILIYSPPAEGKTTLLRSLAYELSSGAMPMRVALVDSREEIGGALDGEALSLDVLTGYPQAEGIRIATAFMNPQVIICDEIGSEEDAGAIAQAQNCGVPLIASAHGETLEGILRREGMEKLHRIGAFGLYVGIKISSDNNFEYKVQSRGEARIGNTG